ncbi:MAG TPA: endonuclease/exonuclease/phosphatase family protein [Nevskia sp.]|nr:endonuclease/exonuclease/phosphatase family protein [Nevskia sp.]
MTASPNSAAQVPIRILTVNTHKGFSWLNRRFVLPELRDALRQAAPDLVFLQEVVGEHELHRITQPSWPLQPHWQFLAETIWGYSAYGRNAVYTHGHHGNAVLSRFPIVSYHNHDVSVGDVERRGLLHCVVEVPGVSEALHAICVHLGLRAWQRRHQLQALCELTREQVPAQAPLVAAGDFNDWSERAHRLLRCARLEDAFVRLRGRAARTFPALWPLLRLDRIYCRNLVPERLQVLSRRPWSHLSDHAALCVEGRL